MRFVKNTRKSAFRMSIILILSNQIVACSSDPGDLSRSQAKELVQAAAGADSDPVLIRAADAYSGSAGFSVNGIFDDNRYETFLDWKSKGLVDMNKFIRHKAMDAANFSVKFTEKAKELAVRNEGSVLWFKACDKKIVDVTGIQKNQNSALVEIKYSTTEASGIAKAGSSASFNKLIQKTCGIESTGKAHLKLFDDGWRVENIESN